MNVKYKYYNWSYNFVSSLTSPLQNTNPLFNKKGKENSRYGLLYCRTWNFNEYHEQVLKSARYYVNKLNDAYDSVSFEWGVL